MGYPLNLTDMYLYMDLENAQYKGVYVDLLDNFNKKHKDEYEFKYIGDDKNADILLRVSQSDEEKGYRYIVTPFSYRAVVLVNVNSTFKNIDELYGLKVGYVENQRGMEEIENRNKGLKVQKISYDTENQAIIALKNNKVDAIILKDWNESNPIERNFRIISSTRFKEKIGVSDKQLIVYDQLKDYFSNLEKNLLAKDIRENRIAFYRYLLKDTPDYDTVKSKYPDLKISLLEDKYFLPIYYKEHDHYKGLLFDILGDIEKILEIPTNVVNDQESANIQGVYIAKKNDDFLETKPYYKAEMGIASIRKSFAVSEIADLDNSTIIVVKGQLVKEVLANKTKDVKFITVSTIDEGIEKLINKEGDYFACYLNPLRAAILNKFVENKVNIVGTFSDTFGMGLGIKKDDKELYNVISTILNSYSVDELISETNKNSQVVIKKDYMFVVKIVLPMIILIIILSILLRKAILNKRKAEKLGNILLETMVKVNQLKESESGLHAKRIELHAEALGKKLNLPPEMIEKLKLGAIIHDIGKVIVPGDILNKNGKLTPEEFEIMKKHAEFGYEITKNIGLGKIVENATRYHHEKWNGSGYPSGLAGENIPLEGRIIGILDVYDSIREDKVYKKGLSHEKAIEIIKAESGKSFDPAIVDVFLANEKIFDEIFNTTLETGDLTEEYYKIIKNN